MKYFGTDGIRDNAEKIIKLKMGYYVGKALTLFKKNKKPVFIARDTRESGEKIVNDIKKGLRESGIHVYDLGVYPTPVLAYFSLKRKTYGLMVTASHNSYHDNGIKIFDNGDKLDPKYEAMIEDVIDKLVKIEKAEEPGLVKEFKDSFEKYLKLYKNMIRPVPFKVCIDLAHGAATTTAPEIFSKMVDDLVILANAPDGHNINLDCGSTHLDMLQSTVLENQCDLGIAFDGDGDRLMVVDNQGEVIDGDFIIYLFAGYLKANRLLKHKMVALSKMCNIGIINALEEKDISVIQTDVGDKYIAKALDEFGAVLGGENSGHIINRRLFKTGDGVLNAVYLLNVLDYYKQSLSTLKNQVSYYPDRLENLRNVDKSLAENEEVIALVEDLLNSLGGDGKILVRPSGTEPMIRVSASAPNVDQVNHIVETISEKIKSLDKEGK